MQKVLNPEIGLCKCTHRLQLITYGDRWSNTEILAWSPRRIGIPLIASFVKFCYFPDVHCLQNPLQWFKSISLLACFWLSVREGCRKTGWPRKENNRLLTCEQLLLPCIIDHFRKEIDPVKSELINMTQAWNEEILCPTFVSCWSVHFSHFITKLKKKSTIFIHLSQNWPCFVAFSRAFAVFPKLHHEDL